MVPPNCIYTPIPCFFSFNLIPVASYSISSKMSKGSCLFTFLICCLDSLTITHRMLAMHQQVLLPSECLKLFHCYLQQHCWELATLD